jgi:hypothetical protein
MTTGFRVHATMTVTRTGERPLVRQVQITARRSPSRADWLYQQLWPAGDGGRALVLEDRGDHRLNGFEYRQGRARRLASRMFGDRFFESDLTLEDLAETFWFWPSRTLVGQEAIGEYACTIVQLRPAAGAPTAYSSVKVWIAPDLSVALRVEAFGRDGRLVKRIGLYRVMKVRERWLPTILTVDRADRKSRTVLEGSRVDQDLHLRAADFSLAAVKKFVVAAEK